MRGRWSFFAVVVLMAVPRTAAMNPLSKVIELMDTLTAKVTREGEEEEKAYNAFIDWCDDTIKNKGFEIKTATSAKAKLEAAITKSTDEVAASMAKIEDLVSSIASDDAELEKATKVRDDEAADFAATEAELVGVIDQVSRASTILQREMAKNPAAFAQVDTSSISGLLKALDAITDAAAFSNADKQKLVSLVQSQQGSGADDDELGAPAAAVYKSHSTGIIDVLEDLKEKSEEQLSDLRKAESNAKHNFALLKQSLEDQISADTKALNNEKAAKAAAEEAKATAEGDLAQVVKDLADAEAALADTQSSKEQTTADHEATVKGRTEELAAIAQAKKVLVESTSGAVGQAYSMLQVKRSQTGSRLQSRADLAGAEVVNLVKRLAQKHHSTALEQLASRIATTLKMGETTGEDPFAKVKELIQGLITKLEAEAGSEATEKAYCDEQIAKTEEKKSELDDDISKLTAKIDIAVAKSAGLKEDVKELQAELAALEKAQAEMDKIRQESHAAFVQAKADLEQGLEGVRQALSVLREYYGSSAAMLQASIGTSNLLQQPAAPEKFEKAAGAGGSIIGILEVVESDFAKSLAEEEAEEDDAAAEYAKTTQDNKVSKSLKSQDVKYKTQEFKSLDKSVSELSADRETKSTELSAVLEYYAKIKERCIAKPETYETRKARRESELAGLKQALDVLDDIALVQHRAKGHRSRFLGLPGQ